MGATAQDDDETVSWFLRGAGTARETARQVDWSKTPLGPPSGWPPILKSTLATLFAARQPMFLWWGPELIQFYNDGYLPSFGKGKHPRAMGQRGRDCWGEIWPIIGPQIEDVMQRATGSWHEDALVPIIRNGRVEDVYWTYSYSPVFREDGSVGGTLVICTETTRRVLGERRARMLHALVATTSVAPDKATLHRQAAHVARDYASDIPFFAVCTPDDDGRLALTETVGVPADAVSRLAEHVARRLSGAPKDDGRVISLGDGIVSSTGEERATKCFVGNLADEAKDETCAVFGISPRLSFDEPYRRFFDQVTASLRLASRRIEEAAGRTAVEAERRRLLEQAPVATALLIGHEHVFELANPAYRKMVGKDDIIGQAYFDAFPELRETSLPGILGEVYGTGESFVTAEYSLPRKGDAAGDSRYYTFTLEPVRDANDGVYGMMMVAVDVTEQVAARRVLEAAHAEREQLLHDAEKASRAKDEFLAMLGHELRNPLSPIVTALQLMELKSEGQFAKEQQIIDRQVSHLIRLVDDLLDVSKIARGKVKLKRKIVDIHDVIHKAVETTSVLLERRKHVLSIESEPGRLFCHGDPTRLCQVVSNLLTNAARYTDAGGRIAIRVFEVEGQVAVVVSDDGIGISSDVLPRIFSLFEQGIRSPERARGGLGIGLALVRNLVTLHGGTVSAHSEGLGHGSQFTVRLPRTTREQADERASRPPPPRAVSPVRVLIVDDNVDAAELLHMALTNLGHETTTAPDAPAALELAARFRPQVAVLDIGLPVMDGYELASRLRRVPGCETCRLIALTGYGQAHDRKRSRVAGFDEHLVKPIELSTLLELVDRHPAGGSPRSA